MSSKPRPRWPVSAKVTVVSLLLAVVAVAAVGAAEDDSSRRAAPVTSAAPVAGGGGEPSTSSATEGRPSIPETVTTTTGPLPVTSTTTTTTTTTTAAGAAVDRLVVADASASAPAYRRDAFGGDWDYDPVSGCNTRERVLIEESLVPPTVDERCRSTNGRWRSLYDGVVVTDVAELQIDHFVPLADAWRSGASAWSDERRRAFANDLGHPETLIAVTGSTNQSKSDSSPDEWLPSDRSAWCRYATTWVDVKLAWSLTVTPAEKATLVQLLAGC